MSIAETPPFIVAIPARYASTRLPAKPLRLIAGDPMVLHVARRALAAGAIEVVVATDDMRIADAVEGAGVTVCLTDPAHNSGTDRLAECATKLGWADTTVVVNLQGDEPLAPPSGIQAVATALIEDSSAHMATLATPIEHAEDLFNPNCVKVVSDRRGRALYFSRAPIPWHRDHFAADREHLPRSGRFMRHIGIYAYRAGFLRTFAGLASGALEQAEALEQLRALEYGYAIAVRQAPEAFPPGVDTEADLVRVIRLVGGA